MCNHVLSVRELHGGTPLAQFLKPLLRLLLQMFKTWKFRQMARHLSS
jgi:hypothetical protein